jgi:hypothetical protein
MSRARTLRNFALVMIMCALAPSAPIFGQDSSMSTPRLDADTSGHGAVLCSWWFYLIVRARSMACGFARQPIDDALDQGIDAIDKFIMANSPDHPTREILEKAKRRVTESDLAGARRDPKAMCEDYLVADFRKSEPAKFRDSVDWLLAVPRKPVANPCL